jgi:hypothetical protein
VGQQEWAVPGLREGIGGQVGPGGRGSRPPAVGQLQDEPWGILPPEVVGHGGKQVADITTTVLEDTDADAANVE